MTTRATVAVLKATPETILEDYDRLIGLAGVEKYLPKDTTVILKDNISWHFPFPSANTTPWQLEGTIRALESRGYKNQVCVQNRTVVTNAFKGEDLNNYVPVFRRYGIPVLYNFKESDMSWSLYEPQAKMMFCPRSIPRAFASPTTLSAKASCICPPSSATSTPPPQAP